MRQIKQVRGVNDVDIDDIEASAPPSEEVHTCKHAKIRYISTFFDVDPTFNFMLNLVCKNGNPN